MFHRCSPSGFLTVLTTSLILCAMGHAEEPAGKTTGRSKSASKAKSPVPDAAQTTGAKDSKPGDGKVNKPEKVVKSAAEWRKQLTPMQYKVARLKATEPAYTGEYWNSAKTGVYHCVCCDQPLFDSKSKFDSRTGWPSYWQPIDAKQIKTKQDGSYGAKRVEVICIRCDAHLGHLFADGPPPTGLRFCINSASLKFQEQAADEK
jgi:peptide-methionine (R)-S-oxide reductase